MEDVVVIGTDGPRSQRLLDEMERRARGLTRIDASRDGAVERRVYRVDSETVQEAVQRVRDVLGDRARDFMIERDWPPSMIRPGQRVRVADDGRSFEATFVKPGEPGEAVEVEDARVEGGVRRRDVGWVLLDDGTSRAYRYEFIRPAS